MLDTALIDALSHALKPRPAVVRPSNEIGESLVDFQKRTEAQLVDAEAAVTAWINHGEIVKAEASASFQRAIDNGLSPDSMVAILDAIIAQIEDACRDNGADFDSLEQSFRRQIKTARRLKLPDAGVIERIADRAMAIQQRELEERGDMVLFLKAWRSEFSTGGRGGPSFDDPDALDRYLREAASA
jgi:hypothetical protein